MLELSSSASLRAATIVAPLDGSRPSKRERRALAEAAREAQVKRRRRGTALERLWRRVESAAGASESKPLRAVDLPRDLDPAAVGWATAEPGAAANPKGAKEEAALGGFAWESSGAFKVVEVPGQGRGCVATRDLPPGTTLLVAKPIAALFEIDESESESEDDDDEEEEEEEEEEQKRACDDPFLVDNATARLTLAVVDTCLAPVAP